ncbi:S41 family peptidase [Xanthomonas tesorieronis]|uniref:S41 family peptidase n=1 Tax=Xanthomonas tesorieronis TaxID=3160839 RepID=UPI0035180FC7
MALADGSLTLRFRRLNLLGDLVRVQVWLGDRDAAVAAWQALDAMAWQEGLVDFVVDKDPATQALLDDPRLADVRRHEALAKRDTMAPALVVPYAPQLTEAQRIGGLSQLWMTARDRFVWFDRVPELDWDRLYLDTVPLVQQAQDTEAYYRVLARFMAKLQDGHTGVFLPKELESRWYARPGLRTARLEGKVVVTAVADAALQRQGVKPGDIIEAIDGEPVERYAERVVGPYASSSTPQDLEVRMYTYGLLAGDAAKPVVLTLSHRDGHRSEVRAARSGFKTTPAASMPLLTFRKDGVAVLRVAQLEDDASVKALAQDLDRVLAAPGLILDLRGNGGGNTRFGLSILRFVADSPLPQVRSVMRDNGSSLQQARSGRLIEWLPVRDAVLTPEPRAYKGPVAMLVDAATFSAGEDTAAVFHLMRRGPLVGQATGGSTGQPLTLALPGGGSARICVKRDSYPDGSDFVGVGVLPDIVASRTIADVREGKDAVLERAVAALAIAESRPMKHGAVPATGRSVAGGIPAGR